MEKNIGILQKIMKIDILSSDNKQNSRSQKKTNTRRQVPSNSHIQENKNKEAQMKKQKEWHTQNWSNLTHEAK
jgi:hypothetical protein